LVIPLQPHSTATSPLSIGALVQSKLQQLDIDGYDCICKKGKVDGSMQLLKTNCIQTAAFASFPSVVVFSLQRADPASATQRYEQKSFQRIIPEEFIELTSLNEGMKKFVLVSVSVHDGLDDGGHYVTLSRFKGKYYFFNDIHSVRKETTLEAAFGDKPPFYVDLSRNALIFYYVQED
jgi:ubiquitin C-terminal hydrolase